MCLAPCNWSFPGEKPFSGLLKNSSEIWNVTEKLGEPLSLFVHSQTLPTVFSCYNLLGLIVIEMSIFVRNACRTNSSPRFWSFHQQQALVCFRKQDFFINSIRSFLPRFRSLHTLASLRSLSSSLPVVQSAPKGADCSAPRESAL